MIMIPGSWLLKVLINVMVYLGKCHSREVRNGYKILVGKPEGMIHSEDRRNWEDDNKINLREIGFVVMDRIHLAQDMDRWWALVNTIMNIQVQ
jgi:hypothetical protein